jgi:type III secretion protein R
MSPLLVLAAARSAPLHLEVPGDGLAGNQLELLGLLAALALVPFAILMVTSFSKIAVVLSIVRSALGTQQAPPTMVLTGLAAVLTAAVMGPTCERIWALARPAWDTSPSASALARRTPELAAPLLAFLVKHGNPEERARFAELARELRPPDEGALVSEEDLAVVVPAFVLTELKEAFIIGFLVFLPFLVLDMLIANILLALGMQTLSPSQVSLPFKLLLFVAVDGWSLLARGLVLGYR